MSAEKASYLLFAVWYATWWIPALWSEKAASRPAPSADFADRIATGIGVGVLFFSPVRAQWPLARLWPEHIVLDRALIVLLIGCFAFCWWARLHLGRLWSGLVTTRTDHRVVDTGPYGLVRHPIYSGVIAAAACIALIKATPLAMLGAGGVALGFSLTARKEERFLRRELGSDAYDAYRRRVPMLVPFLPRG